MLDVCHSQETQAHYKLKSCEVRCCPPSHLPRWPRLWRVAVCVRPVFPPNPTQWHAHLTSPGEASISEEWALRAQTGWNSETSRWRPREKCPGQEFQKLRIPYNHRQNGAENIIVNIKTNMGHVIDWCLFPPKIHVLKPNPRFVMVLGSGTLGRWWGHEGEAFMN